MKFLIRRMELGMPKEDWQQIKDLVTSKTITLSFLFTAISHASINPDQLVVEIEKLFMQG